MDDKQCSDGKDRGAVAPWDRPEGHLIWLLFLLVPLMLGQGAKWGPTLAAVAVFIAIFYASFHRRGVFLWLSRASMLGLGVLLLPYNSFAHTFFMYAGMPGARSSSTESVAIAAVTLAVSYAYFTLNHLDGSYFAIVAVLIAGTQIGVLWMRFNAAARARDESQQSLVGKDAEIERLAKVAERERIARDLHDILGHTLSMIALKAELAEKLSGRDAGGAAREMHEVAEVARNALAEVRETIVGMRSLSLKEALSTVDRMFTAAGILVQKSETWPPFRAEVEQVLAQALLEAGTNIVRHAKASHVAIRGQGLKDSFQMIVEDDGTGGEIRPGNGLNGMRERLNAAGGALAIEPSHPGTRLIITLPQ